MLRDLPSVPILPFEIVGVFQLHLLLQVDVEMGAEIHDADHDVGEF